METKATLGSFNLKKFIILCIKSWPVFVVSVLGCAFLAGVYSVVKPPQEEVMAQLMLKDESGSSSMMMAGQIARSFSLGDMFGGSSTTDNESFVLRSHTVFLNTVKQLDLNISYFEPRLGILWRQVPLDAPLLLTPPVGCADTITVGLNFRLYKSGEGRYDVKVKKKRKTVAEVTDQPFPITVATPYGTFKIDKTPYFNPEDADKFRIGFCSYDAAACNYERIVNIFVPDRKSDFIDLSFVTSSSPFGKLLLNHIIDNYISLSNQYKLDRTNQSLRLVDSRLSTLANELVGSEKTIEAFKRDNKLTDPEVDAQFLMTKTGNIESSLFQAQTNFEIIKLTRDFIRNPENNDQLIPDLISSVSDNPGADQSGSMIHNYNWMILNRMELLESPKSNSLAIKNLDMKIEALRANIIESIERTYQNAQVALNDLKQENVKNKTRLGELPTIEREYVVLKRDNMLQEQIYLFLLQQREELNMSLASRAMPAQVIDKPYTLIDPAGLTRTVLLALAVIMGLGLAAAYVFLIKMPRSPLTSTSEIESMVKAPVLEKLGNDPDAASTLAVLRDGVNAEALRKLRSDVQFALADCDGKAVVVSSYKAGEGKTYVATNLAASLALIGKRAIIIDMSLRDPQVAAALGIKAKGSPVVEYVRGGSADIAIDHVAVDEATLDAIASAPTTANAADIASSVRFTELIDQLRLNYDYIIIDGTSIDGYSDIYSLTALTDMTIVVSRKGVDTAADLEAINALYADGRLKRLAVVANA